ncbi:lytic transglycosylase domain-containing protein [Burkholderia cepacia]|uniref:lytic transglycosylase domain-containing protein n=1 Tax=Burkholderia cepacia TaxID=292 RepID=UPI002ABD7290|nr:lytic transglycosylase domain-containing protein [Burkholderia cepacia]
MTNAFADCIDSAAAYHGVNAALVRSIVAVESNFSPIAHNVNRNGSEDIGLMQINSSWLPMLHRYGITRASLFNACVNAYVGTWILSQNIARLGLNWQAVGAYNAATPALRVRYASKVHLKLMQFVLGTNPVRVPVVIPRETVSLAQPASPRTLSGAIDRSAALSILSSSRTYSNIGSTK